jgi:hypothetical protein
MPQIVITSSTIWTVPKDWSNENFISLLGGGQGGGPREPISGFFNAFLTGAGGDGAGRATLQNTSDLTAGQQIIINVGSGGAPRTGIYSTSADEGFAGGNTTFGLYFGAGGGGRQVAVRNIVGTFVGFFSVPGDGYRLGSLTSGSFTSTRGTDGGRMGVTGSPNGGQGQSSSGVPAAQPGGAGSVSITYTAVGTHQPCVWIS